VKFWTGDFENDNFGIDRVLDEINIELKERQLNEISKDEVLKNLNGAHVLMNVIDMICKKQNGVKIDDLISKKIIAEKILSDRLKDIDKERNSSEGWKPKLPIEITLHEIFRSIPRTSFSHPDY